MNSGGKEHTYSGRKPARNRRTLSAGRRDGEQRGTSGKGVSIEDAVFSPPSATSERRMECDNEAEEEEETTRGGTWGSSSLPSSSSADSYLDEAQWEVVDEAEVLRRKELAEQEVDALLEEVPSTDMDWDSSMQDEEVDEADARDFFAAITPAASAGSQDFFGSASGGSRSFREPPSHEIADSIESDPTMIRYVDELAGLDITKVYTDSEGEDEDELEQGIESTTCEDASVEELHKLSKLLRIDADRIPKHLLEEINCGNCVAFVGAGFSACAGFPTWKNLLIAIAEKALETRKLSRKSHDLIVELAALGTSHGLNQAAQELEDTLGVKMFGVYLSELLQPPDPLPESMKRRLDLLFGIPFRAILTTNFDPLLEGATPFEKGDAFKNLLRASRSVRNRSIHQERPEERRQRIPIIQLHGSLKNPQQLAFTKEGYRRLLYSSPSYVTFLRTVMSTYTVLYMGFSFVDEYLNEIRSEVVSMLGLERRDPPLGYAIINDQTPATMRYYRRHEGVHILNWDTQGFKHFEGLECYLQAINAKTNIMYRFGRLLYGKKILWFGGSGFARTHVAPFFRSCVHQYCVLEGLPLERDKLHIVGTANSIEVVLNKLKNRKFHLIISKFGQYGGNILFMEMIKRLRKLPRKLWAPVIVYSRPENMNVRKRIVTSAGGLNYCSTFSELMNSIDFCFRDASEYNIPDQSDPTLVYDHSWSSKNREMELRLAGLL